MSSSSSSSSSSLVADTTLTEGGTGGTEPLSVDLGNDLPELEACLQAAIIETAAASGSIITECCFETTDLIQAPPPGIGGQHNVKDEEATWDQLMERIVLVAKRLPKLEVVSFDWTIRSPRLGNSFPIGCMATLLDFQRDTIQSLSLRQWGSTLAGTVQDFQQFFQALSHCKHLTNFLIDWDCQFEVTDYDCCQQKTKTTADQWVADSILMALSSIDSLQQVTFLAGRNSYSAQAMQALCSGSCGRGEGISLHITNCSLTNDLVEAICGPTSTIRALHLEDIQQEGHEDYAKQLRDLIWNHSSLKRFSFDGTVAIASTLMEGMQGNDECTRSTTLEEVSMEVWCHSRYQEEEATTSNTRESPPCLCLPPLHNIPLKTLRLEIWDMDPTKSLEMAKTLAVMSPSPPQDKKKDQSLLEQLHLEFNFDDDVGDALRQEIKDTVGVLCNNLGTPTTNNNNNVNSLTHIQIMFGEGCNTFARLDREPSYDNLKYWLDLNKAGRGKLLRQPLDDPKLWFDTLVSNNKDDDDINVAYWILSSNPALFF